MFMEHRTIATKLSSQEITLLRSHCEKKGVTPSALIKQLVLSELGLHVPRVVAGSNQLKYDKYSDSYNWNIFLDDGQNIEVLNGISPDFIENLNEQLSTCINERKTFVHKTRKESVPVPSAIMKGFVDAK
jgi:hypothetical protein